MIELSTDTYRIYQNSKAHKILLFTKFYNKYITYQNLKYLNPKIYRTQSDIQKTILRLAVNGYIEFDPSNNNYWKITTKGINHIYFLAETNKKYIPDTEDGL